MDNKKKILLLAVLGGAGYFAYKKFFKKQEEVEDKPTPLDVGKPTPSGGTSVSLNPNRNSLPEPPPVRPYVAPQESPRPYVAPQESPRPYVAPQVSPKPYSDIALPTWTTLSPTSNFSNSARPLNVTATGGNAANYYATMNGVRSRRKRKPKYCI